MSSYASELYSIFVYSIVWDIMTLTKHVTLSLWFSNINGGSHGPKKTFYNIELITKKKNILVHIRVWGYFVTYRMLLKEEGAIQGGDCKAVNPTPISRMLSSQLGTLAPNYYLQEETYST